MRRALPLWFCLDNDTQAKLASMLSDLSSIPPNAWEDWQPEIELFPHVMPDNVDYDKVMRSKPRPSARSRK